MSFTSEMFESGRLWEEAYPTLTMGETFRSRLASGTRGALTWEVLDDWWDRGDRIERHIREDDRERELLTPQQVAEEFPMIQVPQKNSMIRAEARYLEERDVREAGLQAAYVGRNSSDFTHGMAGFGGAMLGVMSDPIFWATALVPMALAGKIAAVRQTILTAKAAGGVSGRAIMSGATALEGALGETMYSGLHALSRNFLVDKEYTADDFFTQVAFGATLGGAMGFAAPRMLGTAQLMVDERGVLAATDALQKATGRMTYQELARFMRDNRGAIDPSGLGRFMAGRDASTRKTVSMVKERDVGVPRVGQTRAEAFKESLRGVDSAFGRGVKATALGIKRFGAFEFEKARPYFPAWAGGVVPTNRYVRHWGEDAVFYQMPLQYAIVPTTRSSMVGKTKDRIFVSGNPLELAETAERIGAKGGDGRYRMIQVSTEGLKFYDGTAPIPRPFKGVLGIDEGDYSMTYASLNLEKRRQLEKMVEDSGQYDGILYGSPFHEGTLSGYIFAGGAGKIASFGDRVYEYSAKGPEKITKENIKDWMNSLEGKDIESFPLSVRRLYDQYTRGAGEESPFEKYWTTNEYFLKWTRQPSIEFNMKWQGMPFSYTTPLRAGVVGSEILQAAQDWAAKLTYAPGETIFPDGISISGMFDKFAKDPKTADALRLELKKAGVEFPESIHVDAFINRNLPFNDFLLTPIRGVSTVRDRVFRLGLEGLDSIKLNWANRMKNADERILHLDKHPSTMVAEEALVGKYFARVDKRTRIDVDTGVTYTRDVSGEVFYAPEVQQHLLNLGYDSVIFRTAEGEEGTTKRFDLVGRRSLPGTAAQLRDEWDGLRKALDGIGKEKGDETAAAAEKLYEVVLGADSVFDEVLKASDYFQNLHQSVKRRMGQGDRLANNNWQFLFRSYERVRQDLQNAELGSETMADLQRTLFNLERTIEKVYVLSKVVEEGGLSVPRTPELKGDWPWQWKSRVWERLNYNLYSEGDELTNLFKSHHDLIYQSMGGVNVETIQKTIENDLMTGLIASIKEKGGDDLYRRFVAGEFDKELLEIKYYKDRVQASQEGIAGQMTQKMEALEGVSEQAQQIYDILQRGMRYSQKLLEDAHFHRAEIPNYIGQRAYDGEKVRKVEFEEFYRDLRDNTQVVGRREAAEIYDSFYSRGAPSPDPLQDLADMEIALAPQRKIVFKGAEAEFEFLKKYGQGSAKGGGKAWTHAASNILQGYIQSVQSDSSKAAVAQTFGTYPYLAMDVLFEVMDRKRTAKVTSGAITAAQGDRLAARFSRGKALARVILDEYLFRTLQGRGGLAKTADMILRISRMAVLGASSAWGVVIDPVTSMLQLEKLGRKKGGKRDIGRMLGNLHFALWSRIKGWGSPVPYTLRDYSETRAKLGYLMNVATQADTMDYMRRFDDTPTGTMSWLEGVFMRATGSPQLLGRRQIGNKILAGVSLANKFKLPFKELNEDLQALLRTHRITPEVWEAVRGLEGITVQHGPIEFVALRDLKAALLEKYEFSIGVDMGKMFDSLLTDVADTRAIPQRTPYSNAFFAVGRDDPEGVVFNAVKLMKMFQGVMLEALWQVQTGVKNLRGVGQRGRLLKAGGGPKDSTALMEVGSIAAVFMMAGAMSVWYRDLMAGRVPTMPETDEEWVKFAKDAALYSGMLGFLGDFILSDHMAYQKGFLKYITGPAISGPVAGVVGVGALGMQGELGRAWDQAWEVGRDSLPSFGPMGEFVLNSAFLHTLGDLSEAFNTMERNEARRRYHEERGSSYLFD